ncbi:tryptophan synthase subunit alpha [Salinarchaeum sp. Harcht-Bsk1]|uniref:tryptophan synthase subunit alpha n=1 Tax=Salinarchaeum sp. Harcht-Bsk1 TaxID=1333523 RepID=UPI0003424069|nr:tryptophan synthase subunit alpha [Salinarchaeum sp. Harcht-Bsk1]AGM99970.1 tryptophan synthase subunit alpha [Salinarchaeum sp. Harcht-Bsk1]
MSETDPGTGADSTLAEAFADGPAFVPYLVAGDPDFETSREYLEALDRGGADVIELGLPFSEPIAEGPTIQSAIVRALEAGMTPDRFFELAESLDVDASLVCMTYYNLVYQYGTETGPRPFVERAAEAGIEGLVVPDLPAEEADELRAACDEFGLDLIFIVAPTTDGERLERMRELVSGYVYVQARLGTTGARNDVSDQTSSSLDRLADWEVPKAVGFGISSGEHAERIVAGGADGIIVGSALVDVVAEGVETERPVRETATRLEELARELAEGAVAGARKNRPEPEGQ